VPIAVGEQYLAKLAASHQPFHDRHGLKAGCRRLARTSASRAVHPHIIQPVDLRDRGIVAAQLSSHGG
jgi:hypothetical protein